MSEKEFRVEVRVKNNLLYKAMERAGFYTVSAFSDACGVQQTTIGEYLNMKKAPMTSAGAWRASAMHMADYLRVLPEDLFPARYIQDVLAQNKIVREYSADEIATVMLTAQQTPERLMIRNDALSAIDRAMASAMPRHKAALRMHYGLDGHPPMTLDQIGKKLNVTRERVRQMILKTERIMKHPSRGLTPQLLNDLGGDAA